jgi:hypothetical protein
MLFWFTDIGFVALPSFTPAHNLKLFSVEAVGATSICNSDNSDMAGGGTFEAAGQFK